MPTQTTACKLTAEPFAQGATAPAKCTHTLKELRYLERSAVAEEVASLLRHDLRNRMAAVRNAVVYLKRRAQNTEFIESDPRIERFFDLIQEQVDGALEMVDERADFSRLFGLHVSPIRVGDYLQQFATDGEKTSTFDLPASIHLVVNASDTELIEADDREVVLLLHCLIENAVEALTSGGTIEVSSRDDGDKVAVTVRDSGPGLPDVAHNQLLRPFESTKAGHTGLGLSMVLRIANRYRGQVVLRSDHGTSVEVLFPKIQPEASGEADLPATGEKP